MKEAVGAGELSTMKNLGLTDKKMCVYLSAFAGMTTGGTKALIRYQRAFI